MDPLGVGAMSVLCIRMARYAAMILPGLLLLCSVVPASAQPIDVPPTWGGDLWSRPRLHLGLNHDDAVEMYYNAVLTPWLNASLDLQIINPAIQKRLTQSGPGLSEVDTGVVGGLRLYVRF
jgi:hypothetical protein